MSPLRSTPARSSDCSVPTARGKPTTIRMMLDIFRPDRGRVSVFGKALDEAAKNRIGYMPEERGLYRDQKLESTLLYLATLKGMETRVASAVGGVVATPRSL